MQRYFSNKCENDYIYLNSDDMYHINKVMRMKNGDKIEIIYDNETYICGVILSENRAKIIEKLDVKVDDQDIVLIVPLLKEQKMDLVLQKATELGVGMIIPLETKRSVIKVDKEKFEKKQERWQKICKEASEQSKRTSIPIVSYLHKIDDLKNLDGVKLVCSTTEKDKNLHFFLQSHNKCDKIILAVGPEGGFDNDEEEQFVKNGFAKVSLGKRIMRVETVPIFLLSILNYLYMEW